MNNRRGAILVLALAVAAHLAGCTSNPDTTITSTSTSTATPSTAPTASVATTPSTIAPTTSDLAAAEASEAVRVAAEQEAARSSAAAQSAAAASSEASAGAQAAADDAELRACRALAGRGDAYYMRLIPSHAYDLEQAYENSHSESAVIELTSWCGNYGVSLDFLEPSTADQASADAIGEDAGLSACRANAGSAGITHDLVEAYESSHSESDLEALRIWCEGEGVSQDTPESVAVAPEPADDLGMNAVAPAGPCVLGATWHTFTCRQGSSGPYWQGQ